MIVTPFQTKLSLRKIFAYWEIFSKGFSCIAKKMYCNIVNTCLAVQRYKILHFTKTQWVLEILTHLQMMDQLYLKWDNFEVYTAKTFQTARISGDFSDVTLVCEDGHLLDAHKLVLSASSQFFQDLFKMNNHPHPLVYLRGVKAHDLVALVDFVYDGETSISNEHIETFLAIGQDLKIKGLVGACEENIVPTEILTTERDGLKTNQEKNMKTEMETIQDADNDAQEEIATSVKEEKKEKTGREEEKKWKTGKEEEKKGKTGKGAKSFLLVDTVLAPSYSSDALEELDAKVNSFIRLMSEEGGKGLQRLNMCTVCNKIGHKTHIKDHIEAKHFEGISIVCNHCGHTFRTRSALRHHTKKIRQDSA